MDTTDRHLAAPEDPQQLATAAPAPIPTEQPLKPELAMTDAQAQALLMINDAHPNRQRRAKLPFGLIVTILILVILLILASSMTGRIKHDTSSDKPSSAAPGSSGQRGAPSNATTNQINQDVNSCSNPETALSEC